MTAVTTDLWPSSGPAFAVRFARWIRASQAQGPGERQGVVCRSSTRPATNRWVAGECPRPSHELGLCQRTALGDFNPSLPTGHRVICSDQLGEVADDLSVPDQEEVAGERKGVDDLFEE